MANTRVTNFPPQWTSQRSFCCVSVLSLKRVSFRDFRGDPVVRTVHFTAGSSGSIPGWETKIPRAAWRGLKKNREEAIGSDPP